MKHSIWMRLALIILSVSMVLSFAACKPAGNDETTGKETEQKTEVDTTVETEATTDDAEVTTEDKTLETTEAKPVETTDKKPVETTEKKPVETTEKKPVETTEKKPVETTEKKPEETTEKPEESDPYEGFACIVLPEQLATAKVLGVGERKVSEDGSYVNLPGTGAVDGYILAISGNTAPGKYVVMKYRLNNSTFTGRAGFCSNVNAGPKDGSNQVKKSLPVNPDGEWHIVVYNMSAFAKDDQLLPNAEGEVVMNYWRIDFADGMAADSSMDVAYVGIVEDVATVFEFAKANGDKIVEVSEDGGAVVAHYTSTGTTDPAITDVATKYFDAEDLVGKASGGNKISKAELSADKSYVSVYGHGDGKGVDGYFSVFGGNTDVTGEYVIMKYRYPTTNAEGYNPTTRAMYTGNVKDGPAGGDMTESFPVIADGEWHMTVFNIAAHVKTDFLVANEDGTYSIKYFRFDLADGMAENCCIDIEYIAFTDAEGLNSMIAVAKGEGLETVTARLDATSGNQTYYTATGTTTPPSEDETGTGDEVETDKPTVEYKAPFFKFCVNSVSNVASTSTGIYTNAMAYSAKNFETDLDGYITIHGWFAAMSGVEKYQFSIDGGNTWIDIDMGRVSNLSKNPADGVPEHILKNESALFGSGYEINGFMNNMIIDLSDLVDVPVAVTVSAVLNSGDRITFFQILNVFANCSHKNSENGWATVAGDVQKESSECTICGDVVVRYRTVTDEKLILFNPEKIANEISTNNNPTVIVDPATGMSYVRVTSYAKPEEGETGKREETVHLISGTTVHTNIGPYVAILYRSSATEQLEVFYEGKHSSVVAGGTSFTTNNGGEQWRFAVAATQTFSGTNDKGVEYEYDGTKLTAFRLDYFNKANRPEGATVDIAYVGFFASEESAIAFYEKYVDSYLGEAGCNHVKVDGSWEWTGVEGEYKQEATCLLCDATVYRACPHADYTGEWVAAETVGKVTAPCACCGYMLVEDCEHPTSEATYTAVEGDLFSYDVKCELCSFEGRVNNVTHEGFKVFTPDELAACVHNSNFKKEALTDSVTGLKYLHAVMTADNVEGTLTLNSGATALRNVAPYVVVLYRRSATGGNNNFQLYLNSAGKTGPDGATSPNCTLKNDNIWQLAIYDFSKATQMNTWKGLGWTRLDIFDAAENKIDDVVDLGYIAFFSSVEEIYKYYGGFVKQYSLDFNVAYASCLDSPTTNGGSANISGKGAIVANSVWTSDLSGLPFGTSLSSSLCSNGWFAVVGGVSYYKYRVIGADETKVDVFVPANKVQDEGSNGGIVQYVARYNIPASCGKGVRFGANYVDLNGFELQTVTVELIAVTNYFGEIVFARLENFSVPCTHENNEGTWTTNANDPQYETSNCTVCEQTVSRLLTDSEEGLLFFNHEYIQNKVGSTKGTVKNDGPNGMSYVRIMSTKNQADVPVKDKPGEYSWAEETVSLVNGSTIHTNVGQYIAILYRSTIEQSMQVVCWNENNEVHGGVQYFTKLKTDDQWNFVIKKNAAYSETNGQKLTSFRFDYFDTFARTLNDYTDVAYIGFFRTEQAAKDFYAKYVKAYLYPDDCIHSFDYTTTNPSAGVLAFTCANCGIHQFACQHYDNSKLSNVTNVTGSIANITADCAVCGATGVGVANKTQEGKKLYNPGELFSNIGTSGKKMTARVVTDDTSVNNMPYVRFVDQTASEGYVRLNSGVTNEKGVANYVAIFYRTWRNPQVQFWINKANTTNEKGVAGTNEETNVTGKSPIAKLVMDGTWQIAIIDLSGQKIVDTTNGNGWIRLDIMDDLRKKGTIMDIAYVGFFTSRAAAAAYHARYVNAYLSDEDCGCQKLSALGLTERDFYDFKWVATETVGEMMCACKYCGRDMTPIACGHLDSVVTSVENAADLFTYNVKCDLCGFDGVLSGITSDGLKAYTAADLAAKTTSNLTHSPKTDASLSNMPYAELKLEKDGVSGECNTTLQNTCIYNTGRYIAILYKRNDKVNETLEFFITSKSGFSGSDNVKATSTNGAWGFYVIDTNSVASYYDPNKGLNNLRLDTLNGGGDKTKGAEVDIAFIGFFHTEEAANAFYTAYAAAYPATPILE